MKVRLRYSAPLVCCTSAASRSNSLTQLLLLTCVSDPVSVRSRQATRSVLVAAALGMRAVTAQQPEIGNEEAIMGPTDQSYETYLEWWDSYSSWRDETGSSLNLSTYDNEALQWARTSFIQPQLMIHDKFLYDR